MGVGRSRKNRSRGAGSVASKAAVLSASSSLAARRRRSGPRPARISLAPSARARRAVSSPMPALPPITTTVCPSSSGSRRVGEAVVAVLMIPPNGSAERERKRLHARIEELDLELSVSDGVRLPDQLIQPLLGNRAVALVVDVASVSSARRLSVDEHAKSHGSSSRRRCHDEMKIAGVKTVRDPPVGLVQHDGVSLHRPVAGKGPIIELHPCGSSIDATLVQDCSTWRNEVLCTRVAEIVFRGLQVGPIRLGFDTTGVDRSQLITDAAEPGLGQHLLDDSFRLFVSALTELMVSNPPLRIDDVERRPVMVVEGAPDRIVVGDGKIDLPVLHSPADVVDVFFESELRRVNADDHESVFLVFPRPRADI